jgi:antitoxin ParD1/3/4
LLMQRSRAQGSDPAMRQSSMAVPKPSQNVSLTLEHARFIAERVASGGYQTASEVVRTALRLLERFETTDPRPSRGGGIQRGIDGDGHEPQSKPQKKRRR